MSKKQAEMEWNNQFVWKLYALDRASRARLKRNAGQTLATARNVYHVFYALAPHTLSEKEQEVLFLVATLFASVVRYQDDRPENPPQNLGASLAIERHRRQKQDRGDSLDRRFATLLDADQEQLSFRLRPLVRLVAAQRIAIDWTHLMYDLNHWDHQDRFVQRTWAQSYYSPLSSKSLESETSNTGETA